MNAYAQHNATKLYGNTQKPVREYQRNDYQLQGVKAHSVAQTAFATRLSAGLSLI